jgi:hypothetical protein
LVLFLVLRTHTEFNRSFILWMSIIFVYFVFEGKIKSRKFKIKIMNDIEAAKQNMELLENEILNKLI